MGGDDGREKRCHEHAVDDSAALEPSDRPGEICVKMNGVAVAARLRVPRHVRLGESLRFLKYVANFEEQSRF